MIERNENNDTNYARYLQFAYNVCRVENLGFPLNIVTKMIPYDAQKRYIDLPTDCVTYTKVGIIVNGILVLLGLNPKMALQRHYDACGQLQPWTTQPAPQEPNIPSFIPTIGGGIGFYNYYYGGVYGALFGYGPGENNYGSYNYDDQYNRLEFSQYLYKGTTEIYLEYKTNGLNPDGTTMIKDQMIQPIIEGIHSRIALFDTKSTVYLKERTRKNHILAKKQARRFLSPTLNEWYDLSFTNFSQAPK